MSASEERIHEAVREQYGDIARQFGERQNVASCCSPATSAEAGCCASPKLYDEEMLANLPFDVTGLSLGCGDPVTIASLKPGETVLDLGSGGGIDCFLAAKQVGEEGYVIGVDMTPDMLASANANKGKVGARNVEFRQGQIENLPVEDDRIDVVMSNCVINLSPDKSAVFREAFRVLKPGGRVSISDIVTEGEFSPEMRAQLEMWAGCITGAIDIDEYTGLMHEAGFVDVEVASKVQVSSADSFGPEGPRVFSARVLGRKRAGA